MQIHYPFLLVVVFLSSNLLHAQTISPELSLAYRKLLEFKTDSLSLLLDRQTAEKHDPAFKIYLKSLNDVLILATGRNDSLYGLYTEKEKEYNSQLESFPEDDEFVMFVKAEIRLHAGIVRYRYGDQLSAGLRFIQAYKLVDGLADGQDVPLYLNKTAGVLNVLLSLIPEKYEFMLRLIGIRADLTTGTEQLEKLMESKSPFSFESSMILALLNAYYLNDPVKSAGIVQTIGRDWQNSLIYHYIAGLIFSKIRDNEKALKAFSTCIRFNEEYGNIQTLTFYLAESVLKKLDFQASENYYKEYLSGNTIRDFRKTANYRLYLISLFRNDRFLAGQYRKKVLEEDQKLTEADNYVYTLVASGYQPHPEIQKARLLFDGGYYEQSLMMLKSIGVEGLNAEEKLEYNYRNARTYQQLKEFIKAEKYYEMMFQTSFNDHYLVANAHLQMGYIKMENKNSVASAGHFREALKYSGDFYKTSIRNEARVGLRMVE